MKTDLSVTGWKYEYVDLPEIRGEEDIKTYVKEARRFFPKWENRVPKRVWDNDKMFDNGKEVTIDNPLAEQQWQFEQIRRCIEGHGGMCGKMYFYFHFCTIKNISGGFIRPSFRSCDAVWFHLVESCEKSNYNEGNGIICVKRRRGGFSWKQACDSLHDALFKIGFRVGMTSKDEDASKDLMKKVWQLYEKLPTFIKHPWSNKTQESILFARKSKDNLGQRTVSGNESEIYCKAPTDSCFEGEQIGKLVIDEAGKIKNLQTIMSMGMPTLMEETVRVGVPILFGTAGEQEKAGKGQKYYWRNHDKFDLIKFFHPGWAGLHCGNDGNDDIEKAVSWIWKEREKLSEIDDPKALVEFIQQYPLYAREAFLSPAGSGVGDQTRIREQRSRLDEIEVRKVNGKFRRGMGGEPKIVWVPNTKFDSSGKVTIYEHPSATLNYVAGCDPADHDYVQDGGSNMSMYIFSKHQATRPGQIVASYTDRPGKANDYYEQSILALEYYGGPQVLIENNRTGMISYYEDTGYLHLLKLEPIQKHKTNRTQTKSIGVRATVPSKREMERCINEYTHAYCDLILDDKLLEQFTRYGEENTDNVMAFGWTLVSAEDDLTYQSTAEDIMAALPKSRLRKGPGGKIIRVTS